MVSGDKLFLELIKLLKVKNDAIRKIDFAIIQLNDSLRQYFNEHPEILNYTWEPLSDPPDKLIYGAYPKIYIILPPFKATIEYEQLIDSISGEFSSENIKRQLIDLICKKLVNSTSNNS